MRPPTGNRESVRGPSIDREPVYIPTFQRDLSHREAPALAGTLGEFVRGFVSKAVESACWHGATLVADALVPGFGRGIALLRTTTSFVGAAASFADGRGVDIKVPVLTDPISGFSLDARANVLATRESAEPALSMIVDFEPFDPPRPGEVAVEAARRDDAVRGYLILAPASAVARDDRIDAASLTQHLTAERDGASYRHWSSGGHPAVRPPVLILWADPAADLGLMVVVPAVGTPYSPVLFTVDHTVDGSGRVRLSLDEAHRGDVARSSRRDASRVEVPMLGVPRSPAPPERVPVDTPAATDPGLGVAVGRSRVRRATPRRAPRPRRVFSRRPDPGPDATRDQAAHRFWINAYTALVDRHALGVDHSGAVGEPEWHDALRLRHGDEIGRIEEDIARELPPGEPDARAWADAVARTRRSANLVNYLEALQGYVLLGMARRLCAESSTVVEKQSIVDDLFRAAGLPSPLDGR